MPSSTKQFFSGFWGAIIAFGLSVVLFIGLLMFNICIGPDCFTLLIVLIPPVLFFWWLFRRYGFGRPVIFGLTSGVFLLMNGVLIFAGTNPLNSIWIILGILFVIFWIWIFFSIIAAIFRAAAGFVVLLRRLPRGLKIVFLFIKNYPSVAVTIAANLMPLAGVLFYGWDPFAILFIYWIQTGIIGFFSLLKIRKVCEHEPLEQGIKVIAFQVQKGRARPVKEIVRDYLSIFLLGMITSMILIILFTGYASKKTVDWDILNYAFSAVGASLSGSYLVILLGSLSFFANHGYSYLANFLGKKEYLHSDLEQELTFPIDRVGSIWGAIFVAITVLGFIPNLLAVIVSLVFFKILLDVYAHVREHGRFIL